MCHETWSCYTKSRWQLLGLRHLIADSIIILPIDFLQTEWPSAIPMFARRAIFLICPLFFFVSFGNCGFMRDPDTCMPASSEAFDLSFLPQLVFPIRGADVQPQKHCSGKHHICFLSITYFIVFASNLEEMKL